MRPPEEFPGPAMWLPVQAGELLIVNAEHGLRLAAEPPDGRQHRLGSLGDRPCLAVDVEGTEPPAGLERIDLRSLYGQIPELEWSLASRAVQVVGWDRNHRFCGRCATPTEPAPGERERVCPNCGLSAYPRLSPAVIVLVTRGEHDEQALLAWGRRSRQRRFSTLAGFVEIGEGLEEAVSREVYEEAGVLLKDITYVSSQPWPFPSQLMVGFRARHAGGEIVVQESEIVEARWFTPDEVGDVTAPHGSFTIAAWLIDGWLDEQRQHQLSRRAG